MAEEIKVRYSFGTNCVCIGRVSTSIQSQTAQERDLIAFAKSWGFKNVKTFFTTESGFLEFDEKQGWNLVTDFLGKHPEFKVIICPELSRLSRKEHILFKIKDYLIENKIQLIVKDINFVLYNEWGEIPKGNDIVFALYASLADSEMRQKKERKTRVLKDNRQLGYSIGGKELFGYTRYYEKKDGRDRSKYRINDKEAEEIRTVYRWYAFGIDGDIQRATILSITKECIERGYSPYLHSKRNVNKCLKEQAYLGSKETHNRVKNSNYWNYHKTDEPKYIEGQSYICTYPPILTGDDTALFDLVQKRLKLNNSKYAKHGDNDLDRSRKHTNILGKLLVCPVCGTYLHAEYQLKAHSQRPHLGTRASFYYRCNSSRGVINDCAFKRCISMPMTDSVVWSYCKHVVYKALLDETHLDINKRVAEIMPKIQNLETKIQEYDIEGRRKVEEAILRAKTKSLKDPQKIEMAINEFNEHIEKSEKELNSFKARKLELEQEVQEIKEAPSFIDSAAKIQAVSNNKKMLYKYIHKVVQRIEIIGWDKYHLVIQIKYKRHSPFQKKNDYICIYSKTTKQIDVLLVYSYNPATLHKMMRPFSQEELSDHNIIQGIYNGLPSTDALYWDRTEGKFKVDNYAFSLEELKDYYRYPTPLIDPVNPRSGATVVGAPILVTKLEVERLQCYAEDEASLRERREL